MSSVIGQRITRFWNGERYVFERTEHGNWKCVHQDSPIIPQDIIEEIEAAK